MPTFSPARLTAARLQAGLGMPQLGSLVGRTSSAVWNYEVGKSVPPAAIVKLIAEAVGLPVSGLYEPDPTDPVLRALRDLECDTDTDSAPPQGWTRRDASEPTPA
ncbi:helix-turn-helix domain-containing protein [Streptomyces sp. NBC_01264]|uniref:helix-turn-helix domain-containing protein n=1 Tax=Streptomyces sp. NBC_01264 TaxID=2903804 RepID=UPI002256A8F7|nr:helix-turn-helix transcriptional regulator [Streptomyces sp. NBC_01264]MCX4783359.1 helix-turn-helix domain-containing protein [Streptomyces sp. NBC_01264]